MRDDIQEQVDKALDILRPGRLYSLSTGEEVPTTLVERALNVVEALHGEQHHAEELRRALAAERGDSLGAATVGWAWEAVHGEWRKQVRHVRMWVHRMQERPGWVCAGGNSWNDDDLFLDMFEDSALFGMQRMDKKVRDFFEQA